MLDDFFMRALVAGVGLAITAGPLGCFVVWRRMAYFGDTMAHSALLGVALSLLMDFNLLISVFAVAATVSILLLLLQKRGTLSTDALLGILSHATLAIGLVMVSFMTWVRIDLVGFLFGDILAVTRADVDLVWGGGILVTFAIVWMWRPLIASTVNPELAEAEGMEPEKTRLAFMLLMALVIAIAMKIVGILLITSLLIIPAATARRFSTSPEIMAVLASVIGALAVIGGLFGSLKFDTPSGPSIVVAALGLFILSLLTKPRVGGVDSLNRQPGRPGMTTQTLTRNQGLVLDVLSHSEGPLSAYTILDKLRDSGFRAPLQVYRALDKLLEFGLVHRLESINAFVACAHPEEGCHAHGITAFTICETCGKVTEFHDHVIEDRLKGFARDRNFKTGKTTIEIRGTCAGCA